MKPYTPSCMLIVCALSLVPATLSAAEPIAELQAAIAELRSDYEARIAELERRLAAAESQLATADATTPAPAETASRGAGVDSGNAFNPAIGVIFSGSAWAYGEDPEDYAIPGFPLAGETGPAEEGFTIGETEIDISANVDDRFTAWLTAALAVEDGEAELEIEEAWIETLTLPAGLSARVGRMFSGIGYLNEKHAHAWDFADLPLPYQALLGGQYIDDGLRLTWLAPTDLFWEVSAEAMRGAAYPFAGEGGSGFGAWTLRTRLGGDLGFSHSWQAGLSWLSGDSLERASGGEDEPLLFTGEADLWIADFVWKWAPDGNWRARNFKFALEYLQREERGHYLLSGERMLPWAATQEGWYAEGVYQFRPQWRIGARLDRLSGDRPGAAYDGTPLAAGGDPRRYSLMADWSHSEFSRLRLQYTRDQAAETDDNQFGLQYILSIGAHGAHSF